MRVAALLLALALSAQAPPPPAPPPPAPPPPAPVVADLQDRVGSDDDDLASLPLAVAPLRPRPAPPVVGEYRADPDFQYDTPQAQGPSLWERFWRWVGDKVFGPIAENTTWGFWQVVLAALAVGALGWVVARLLSADGGGVFGTSAPSATGLLLDVEDIAAVDLGARLADALGRGDLRQAVRLRYLLVLQALDADGAVAWRRDKTNRQYVAEVNAHRADLAGPFRQVTRAFDAVWYGERAVPAGLYDRLAALFDRAAP